MKHIDQATACMRALFGAAVIGAAPFGATPALASPLPDIGPVLALSSAIGPGAAGVGGLRSFRMRITTPRLSGSAIMNFAEDRQSFAFTNGTSTTLAYLSGDIVYARDAGKQWTKLDLARVRGAVPSGSTAPSVPSRHALPDRFIAGKRMGAFRFDAPANAFDARLSADRPVTVTCLYEKTSGHPTSCTAPGVVTLSFDRYDDARNAVRIPPEALRAPAVDLGPSR